MASGNLAVQSNSGQVNQYSWRVVFDTANQSWRSVDIAFTAEPGPDNLLWPSDLAELDISAIDHIRGSTRITSEDLGAIAAKHFLLQCLQTIDSSNERRVRIARLLIPRRSGRIVRSDCVSLRLVDCNLVETVTDFATPRQLYNNGMVRFERLEDMFAASAAGLMLQYEGETEDTQAFSLALEDELVNRLSFPWILEFPSQRQTLVIVEGSRTHPINGGTGPGIYLAAKALGLDMVVLDNAGHWLEGPEYAHWRRAFIPTKLVDPPDPDLSNRILKSIQEYGGRVDGIVTFCDSYMSHVANAAKQLGLPTAAPYAYEVATDKYKTSVFEGHTAYHATGISEAITIATRKDLEYPVIIKPCNGWSSEGVFRVDQPSDMELAVRSIDTMRHGQEFVIEKYCDGPEVDANFVLLDGEVLFFEVCDDFPKSADVNGSGSLGTFIELDSVFPSTLPQAELDMIRKAFHASLLRLGLRDGIMHIEGRIQNSSRVYQSRDGVVDLHDRENTVDDNPYPWLIEINPRPPGMKGTQVIESTHGIDYWGLAMLLALQDENRARALAQPFRNGPQYTCVMVFIPADYSTEGCEGIFDSDDICIDLIQRRPDLAAHISKCGCLVQRGQKVPHPSSGINSFVAYFNVFSRSSRNEALQLANEVRAEVRVIFK